MRGWNGPRNQNKTASGVHQSNQQTAEISFSPNRVKNLNDHEAITEVLSLMRKNGRKPWAMLLSSRFSSIDNIECKYSDLLSTVQNMRVQLAEAAEQSGLYAESPPNYSVYQMIQSEIEKILAKVSAVKEKMIVCAKSASENYKQMGASGLDTALSSMNARSTLATLRKQANRTALNIIILMKRTETIQSKDRSPSAIRALMRAFKKILSYVNHTATSGVAENLKPSADIALACQVNHKATKAGKSQEKNHSIRQDLDKKRAEALALAQSASEKEHKSPEVKL